MAGVAVTALPLLLILGATALGALSVARSLRDETVLEVLRAEVRSVGEVQRAVSEVRSSRTRSPTPR